MSIPNDTPMKRRPTHHAEVLREDFIPDDGLTVSGLAEALGVSRQTVNELLRERRVLSPEMPLLLSALSGAPRSPGSIFSGQSTCGTRRSR